MKNLKYFLIVLSFVILPMKSMAYTYTVSANDYDCVKQKTCLLLCNYTIKSSTYSQNVQNYVSLYYHFDKNNFSLGYTKGRDNQHRSGYLKGPDDLNKIFGTDGRNVYFSSGTTLSSNNIICPKNAYIGNGGMTDSLCFDENGEWCAESKSGILAKYGKKDNEFVSVSQDYNYDDAILSYFKNWIVGDITVEDIISGKYKSMDDITSKIVTDFKENYLYNNNVPRFIKNSNGYVNGVELARANLDQSMEKLKKELTQKQQNGSITEEEAAKVKKVLENIDENFDESVQDTLNGMDTVEGKGQTIDVHKVDICSSDNSINALKAFQIIGYILLIAKLIIPLILIILASIDFAKAVIASGEKPNKDVLMTLMRRFIAAFIIFFIPTILDFVLSLIDGTTEIMEDSRYGFSSCTKCLFDPLGNDCKAKDLSNNNE